MWRVSVFQNRRYLFHQSRSRHRYRKEIGERRQKFWVGDAGMLIVGV